MFPAGVWSWFGIRVLPSGQVAYRVVTVESNGLYRVGVYDRGETGELWYKRIEPIGQSLQLDEAIFIANRHVQKRCWKYETVETKQAEVPDADTPPSIEGWWFKVFGVEPDAPVNEVRAAYRSCLHKCHPDGHMDESKVARAAWGRKTRLVVAAWKRYKNE